ncbi:MAG: FAD-dependent oxidoreductase [Oligoflexus sp.]
MKQQHIAVVGSGMAGLAAAWICQQAGHDVTVFEAQNGRGMDAHTLSGLGPEGQGWIDVPLRVMSPHAWPSVLALCAHHKIATFPVDTFVSYSWHDQSTWLRSARIKLGSWHIPSVGSWRYLNREAFIIVKNLLRMARELKDQAQKEKFQQQSLQQFFQEGGYDPLFWRGFLFPILTTICTCKEESLLNWPAKSLLPLTERIMLGRSLVRLKGGTGALVDALAKDLRFVSGSPVVKVAVNNDGVSLNNKQGVGGRYDRVIFATQANQLSFLQEPAFSRELDVLRSFQFDDGELFVHRDQRFMPKKRSDWTALNFQSDRKFDQSMFTVWVNPIEPSLSGAAPLFQTWNPSFEPDDVLCRVALQRAVVSQRNQQAIQRLQSIHSESGRRSFFCGAWAAPGVPLLESAVRSAMAVAKHLNIVIPWDLQMQEKEQVLQPGYSSPVASMQ